MKLEFSRQILKNPQISNLMKIRPVGAELFLAGERTDRRTDMTKLRVAFRSFANAPKSCGKSSTPYYAQLQAVQVLSLL